MSNHFKMGVISDTHGFLDPQIKKLFRGVDHILHAGDIGPPHIVMELEEIAPVTAVMGNTDYDIDVRETELITLAGWKILVHHIVSLPTPAPTIGDRIKASRPDMVVFGHTHQAYSKALNRTHFLNPGYSGRPKMNAERSVALVEFKGKDLEVEFLKLDA